MEDRVYIREAAERLDRTPATLRSWERYGWLPPELQSHRGERGWRYWTQDQIVALTQWMFDRDLRPGKGLPHYKPDKEKIRTHVMHQRRPRKATRKARIVT